MKCCVWRCASQIMMTVWSALTTGVLNRGADQAVFIDTPGHARRTKRALHRLMARQIHQAVEDCDVALLLVEAKGIGKDDRALIEILESKLDRTFLVLNKIDALPAKSQLLPTLQSLAERPFAALIPISAQTGENLPRLRLSHIDDQAQ